MADPRIPLKNQYLAGALAYLVPGAGHLYQGRLFKGALYFVCIVGTYLFGLYVSEGKAAYWRWEPGNRNIAFFAQAGVGAVAIPAIIQHRRYVDQANQPQTFDLPFSAEFHLLTNEDDAPGEIVGRIRFEAVEGEFGREIRGTFTGTQVDENGRKIPLELNLAAPAFVERNDMKSIAASRRRMLQCDVIAVEEDREEIAGSIVGYVERPFVNRFAVPLSDEELQDLNRRLGKFFELANVFTWIAGLLNLLAVWDAVDGPAYGYGDEEEEADEQKKETPEKAADSKAASATAGADGEPPSAEKKPAAEKPVA